MTAGAGELFENDNFILVILVLFLCACSGFRFGVGGSGGPISIERLANVVGGSRTEKVGADDGHSHIVE